LANVGPTAASTEQVFGILDSNATVSDVELDAANNYNGASLQISRNGGANAQDTFGFNTTGAGFTVSGSNLIAGGNTIATFSVVAGLLAINFTSFATSALADDVMQHITYANQSDTPPASIQLNYVFSDGLASDTASITVNITDVPEQFANIITNLGNTPIVIPDFALLYADTGGATDVTGASGPAAGDSVTYVTNTTYTDANNNGGSFTYAVTGGSSPGSRTAVITQMVAPLIGTAGADIIISGSSGTTLIGGDGNDVLLGGNSGDTYQFDLNDGTDRISDGSGNDTINVKSLGADLGMLNFERVNADLVLQIGSTNVTIMNQYTLPTGTPQSQNRVETITFDGGGTIYGYVLGTSGYALSTDPTDPLTETGNSQDVIASSTAGETLNGGGGNDLLFGNGGVDQINGQAGNDLIVAGTGDDTLDGGDDNDVLVGGAGRDTLIGGNGADHYVWTSVTDTTVAAATADQISGFSEATLGELIDLSLIDANTGLAGDQAFALVGAPTTTVVANSITWSFDGTNTIVRGDVNGDTVADFTIVVLGNHNLNNGGGNADFLL
ncbi:calcium-binding protein, partial [Sphingomonas hankyongi]